MSLLNTAVNLLMGPPPGTTGYSISRSLRFNSSDSVFLSRTPASAGNRKTWTFSCWLKRGLLGSSFQTIIGAGTGGNAEASIRFNSDDALEFYAWTGGYNARLYTTQVFRDVSAWYHLVAVFDTPNATADQRIRLYVNGIEITTFSSRTNPTQNYDGYFNNSISHTIGDAVSGASPRFFNGYLADIHFIDGQALTPSSFTEVSATTGQLIPKAYTGSFGTNGFWLKFSDNSAATATTLGKDYSGNSNNWTPNNLSVTAGAGNDSLVDTPTSYGTDTSAGGEVRGNYCTLNPLAGAQTLANGNLDFSNNTTDSHRPSTIAMTTGKWYCEFTTSSYGGVPGLVPAGFTGTYPGSTATSWGWYGGAAIYNNAVGVFAATFTTNDIIQLAFDADSGKLWFGKNGTWLNSGNPGAGTGQIATVASGTWHFAAGGSVVFPVTLNANFGQRAFAYTAPSGFKALVDTNLPAPVVAKPNTVMDVKLYTGNGSTQTISGLGFSPDVVWLKSRSGALNHALFDTIRTAGYQINPNLTDAETLDTTKLSAFTSDGFTLGSQSGVNGSGSTFVAWTWDAGTSTVTNTQGSITSSVRANASAGFSIVTWTAPNPVGSIASVGHGLNAAPQFMIFKNRDLNNHWTIYHSSFSNLTRNYLKFSTESVFTRTQDLWGTINSTVFNVDQGFLANANEKCVAYCFAPVAGYSSFGSYTGNGSTDGPFVYTGFRPRWIMVKSSSIGGSPGYDWIIHDTSRSTYNLSATQLIANGSVAENQDSSGASTAGFGWDILSNGFKIRTSTAGRNQSGQTYIYAAFAENPFQYARAR